MKQKVKSLSSLKKRIRRSAGGKFMHKRGGTNHNNACKSKRRKRVLNATAVLTKEQGRRMAKLVPYK
jgi:ribosomal protein L35